MSLFPRCQDIRIGHPAHGYGQDAFLPKKVGNGALTGDEWRALRSNAPKPDLFPQPPLGKSHAAVFAFRWVRLFSG
ncbi:hypothetical protein LJR030_004862 [Rhizobium sp. LjRoot30]|uniref:hypothetical protein n=1 Tax=Rhizobium sp. LjRoot30 TaxID=3342320 RepID=UPI003ED0DD5B